MFIIDKDGDYSYVSATSAQETATMLPTGAYRVNLHPMGLEFKPTQTSGDTLIDINTPVARKVAREIADFFNPGITERLRAAGLKHRRGIILHGKPGTGKTSLVRALLPTLLAHNAVVLVDPGADPLERLFIPAIRLCDPDRPIVLIWDEFERTTDYSQNELLQLLDGLNSPDHLLTIGTTNYIERIPDALKKRPSRFGLVLEMPQLSFEARRNYAVTKFPMLENDMILSVVDMTADVSLDHLEEACKLALMGYDPDEIRDRIQDARLCLATGDDDDED